MAIEVHTTTGTREEARRIARMAVEQGLCACAHIDEIESVYAWKGQVENETEFRLVMKCSKAASEALQTLILAHHPYEEPAIVVLPIIGGSESYLSWIAANSDGSG
ncbi:divalent cation tolerance protein CutA [Paracoccus sp. S-4012]|nr:divalent cation tolerance protein CutA [Paracoccus sp. S-4012]